MISCSTILILLGFGLEHATFSSSLACPTGRLKVLQMTAKNRVPVSQQVWHDKDPSFIKPIIAKQKFPFYSPSLGYVSEVFLNVT